MQRTITQNSRLEYQQFFSQVAQDVFKFKNQKISLQVLEKHHISLIVNKENFYLKNFSQFGDTYFGIQGTKSDGLTVLYQVILGNFLLYIKVLNINQNVRASQDNIYDQGGFGVIFKVQLGRINIAIKRINFQKNTPIKLKINSDDYAEQNTIKKAIRQYCIYKICSILHIGPAILSENNYDLVCYNDCIQFPMQFCENYAQNLQAASLKVIQNNLKFNLHLLHQYGFIHRDIKPCNILFSNTKKKFVLADFGLTHTVAEIVGEKTLTTFSGTDSYVSEQMKQLYIAEDKKGFVDLFLNDLVGLKKTLKSLQQMKKIPNKKFSKNPMSYQTSSDFCQEMQQQYYEQIEQNNVEANIDNHERQNYIIQSVHSSKQFSSSSISLLSTFEQKIELILPKYARQINFYISKIVYLISFENFDNSEASIQNLVQQLQLNQDCINNNLKEYLKIRILQLFHKTKELPIKSQSEIKQYINLEQKIVIEKNKQKIQFLARHYTASIQIIEILNYLIDVSSNRSQIQRFKECQKCIESKMLNKKDQTKSFPSSLLLKNFQKILTKFKIQCKYNKTQKQSKQLSLQYLLFLNFGIINWKAIYSNIKNFQTLRHLLSYNQISTSQENYSVFRDLLIQEAKFIFNKYYLQLKSNPKQKLTKQTRFFEVLILLNSLSEEQKLAHRLIQIEQLMETSIWQSMSNINKFMCLRALICHKVTLQDKMHQNSPFIIPNIKIPQKLVISKQNFLHLLKQFQAVYQQINCQKLVTIPCSIKTLIYKKIAKFLIINLDFDLAETYIAKIKNFHNDLILPNNIIIENVDLMMLQFYLFAMKQKWKQAKQCAIEAKIQLSKAPQNGYYWKSLFDCYNGLAYVYSKQGNHQQSIKYIKECINLIIINEPFLYEKIIYLADNLVFQLISTRRFSEIKLYAQMSIKAKCNLIKQKILNRSITPNQFNKIGVILLNKCQEILLDDPQRIIYIIQLYIQLMKPNLWLFKSEYMLFCYKAAKYYYQKKNYLKIIKYIPMYLELIPITLAAQQYFYLIQAYINSLIINQQYYQALRKLKKYVVHCKRQDQLKYNFYKQLFDISKYLSLAKKQVYRFMYQKKFYIHRDHQMMSYYFQKKFKNLQKSHLKLKIVQKALKSL